jgi:hypothetical protein
MNRDERAFGGIVMRSGASLRAGIPKSDARLSAKRFFTYGATLKSYYPTGAIWCGNKKIGPVGGQIPILMSSKNLRRGRDNHQRIFNQARSSPSYVNRARRSSTLQPDSDGRSELVICDRETTQLSGSEPIGDGENAPLHGLRKDECVPITVIALSPPVSLYTGNVVIPSRRVAQTSR